MGYSIWNKMPLIATFVDKTTTSPSTTKKRGHPRHKSTMWTREKIFKLIELYRKSDCLWNHYSKLYKNKECRTKAIEHICSSLNITKNDYGKKVHNLRNQFNSELKKFERRLEESGGEKNVSTKSCRWEHFETLMFLRPIIEPRPGYQAQCKKMVANFETEAIVESNASAINRQVEETARLQALRTEDASTEAIQSYSDSTLSQHITETRLCPNENSKFVPASINRDQWDAFGEMIANEFRNLNSAVSRKKLKRKIMQVVLEIGEEDDVEYTTVN
ncbi:CG10904 [Drosophila busckii]|uniref:CG10904 n=1 Tax=Drosophila busckii TaxID=30019 RepID=A0A0M4EES8_DROBS|nr:uncharacterized protein LOC108595745 [Drosophila busckii]ALC42640.1 CG10904 [Drosophila busckii]